MALCGQFTLSVSTNCAYPLISGTGNRAYIMNHDDYEAATKAFLSGNAMVLESIALAGAATAFYVDGINNSNAPSFALVPQTYGDVFDHTFNFLIFDLSNATKEAIQGSVGGRFVVVYENSFKGVAGESAFEVLGADNGLKLTALTRDPLNNDNQGAYVLTMNTAETGKESKMPLSFFDTDYATTKAALEALL